VKGLPHSLLENCTIFSSCKLEGMLVQVSLIQSVVVFGGRGGMEGWRDGRRKERWRDGGRMEGWREV
jgi:hypothetical protein